MSERTVIVTVEVTKVYKNIPEEHTMDKKAGTDMYKRLIKNVLDADDVVVTNVQEFVGDPNE